MIYLESNEFSSCSNRLLEAWSDSLLKRGSLVFICRGEVDTVTPDQSEYFLILKNSLSWFSFLLKLKPGTLVLLEIKQGKFRLLWLLLLIRVFRGQAGCLISERVDHSVGTFKRLEKRAYFMLLNRVCDHFLCENRGTSDYLSMKGIDRNKLCFFPDLCVEDSHVSLRKHFLDDDQKHVQIFHPKPEILNEVTSILETDLGQNSIQFYINQQQEEQLAKVGEGSILAYPRIDKGKTQSLTFDLSLFFNSHRTIGHELLDANLRGERIMLSKTYPEGDDFIDPAVNGFIFPDDNARIIAEQIKLSLFHCRQDKFLDRQKEIKRRFSTNFKVELLQTLIYA